MGLFSTTTHNHFNENLTTLDYPKNITVNEIKAPTDDSVRLMEEMHEKAIKNIIAKVRIEDNLVSGVAYCVLNPIYIDDVEFIFKFSINGQEFNINKKISSRSLDIHDSYDVNKISEKLNSYAKAIMIWYSLKKLTSVLYEQITNEKYPQELLNK